MNKSSNTFGRGTIILASLASLVVGAFLVYTLFPSFSSINSNQARSGDKVFVLYTLKLPNGNELEKVVDSKKPFEFVLGKAMVIRGWEETVENMTIGEKKTVTISSDKAYGHTGVPNENKGYFVPPDSPVILDVELLDIKR